MGSIGGEFKST